MSLNVGKWLILVPILILGARGYEVGFKTNYVRVGGGVRKREIERRERLRRVNEKLFTTKSYIFLKILLSYIYIHIFRFHLD